MQLTALTADHALTRTVYDDVPYPGHSHAETHPNRVAAIARLFGVAAPKVAIARILEIGCGDGNNLLPIAHSLPKAHCAGFDLAASAIERARTRAVSLQLNNVELSVGDLASIGPLGRFDYIVAHGLYSWIPRSLRDALLRFIHGSLSPNGVAFVSYNTFPGWHIAGMVREMLRYHTRGASDAMSKVTQARALLDFVRVAHDDNDPYGRLLAAEAERIARHSPAHLFHDDLADVNDPVYFEEFVAHAARFDLEHVADADFATMMGNQLPEDAREKLEQLRGNPIAHGQYLDFVRCRRFRESLLCRAQANLVKAPIRSQIRTLLAASAASAQPTVDFAEGIEAEFRWGERACAPAARWPRQPWLHCASAGPRPLRSRRCWPGWAVCWDTNAGWTMRRNSKKCCSRRLGCAWSNSRWSAGAARRWSASDRGRAAWPVMMLQRTRCSSR